MLQPIGDSPKLQRKHFLSSVPRKITLSMAVVITVLLAVLIFFVITESRGIMKTSGQLYMIEAVK